ncbi:MAG: hypothetical protein EBW18_08525, partial [Burkholderiaceae bacterium]|nr:hypothetical protein [Burkholderiaceae bacterium]
YTGLIKSNSEREHMKILLPIDGSKTSLSAAKGRGGMLDLLIGSVAQRVVSSAKQPALLVK